jgi:hypothetical protein
LRGAAIYSGGRFGWTAVDTLLDVLNGRGGRAAARLVAAAGRAVRAGVRRKP